MKIEHTIKRQGGSVHQIGGVAYHFQPDSEGRHVADVTNKAHAERFLSIPGFVALDGKKSGSTTKAQEPEADTEQGDEGEQGGEDEQPLKGVADLSELNKAELMAIAKDAGIKVDARLGKDKLIAAIEENTEASEA